MHHALVVCVGFQFGLIGCLWPAAHRGLGAFALHVRAFDEADRNAATAGGDTLARPVLDLQQRFKRVGNVGLQRNARLDMREPGAIQRAHESLGREFLVAIFLHVEIDELRHGFAAGPREPRTVRREK